MEFVPPHRIDSKYNKAVMANIVKEIGDTKFPEKQIKGIPYYL